MSLAENKAAVQGKLQKAIELELSTIPPYLVAMYSIMPGTNTAASAIIRSVFMEEMLHILLAANILSATGGSVCLGKENIPAYPCRLTFQGKSFRNREFDIHLEAFSRSAVNTFMQIELPEFLSDQKESLRKITIEGYTIGEFYNTIKQELTQLCTDFDEQEIFNGDPNNQVSEQYYWGGGGKAIVVTSLDEALAAIDVIVEQGEGSSGLSTNMQNGFFDQPIEVPHYFRFKEIYEGRYFRKTDSPTGPPTGETLDVDYKAVQPLKPDCKQSDFAAQPELKLMNDRFNGNYSMMLHQLQEGFNGNPRIFYTAIMNGMRNLTPLARNIVQTKLELDPLGRHACPTFEWISPDTFVSE